MQGRLHVECREHALLVAVTAEIPDAAEGYVGATSGAAALDGKLVYPHCGKRHVLVAALSVRRRQTSDVVTEVRVVAGGLLVQAHGGQLSR